MTDEKTKINLTKKLQELVKKRNTPLIVTEQNELKIIDRRISTTSSYNAESYSYPDE